MPIVRLPSKNVFKPPVPTDRGKCPSGTPLSELTGEAHHWQCGQFEKVDEGTFFVHTHEFQTCKKCGERRQVPCQRCAEGPGKGIVKIAAKAKQPKAKAS